MRSISPNAVALLSALLLFGCGGKDGDKTESTGTKTEPAEKTTSVAAPIIEEKSVAKSTANANTPAEPVAQKEKPLPGAPASGEAVRTDSGLTYYDLEVGTGPSPANEKAVVKVHYTGWFRDGAKMESSIDRNEPITQPLGEMIPGWIEGIASMKLGGKRKLVVPAELAYGARGGSGKISPNATLVFDVELLEIVE